MKIPSSTEAEAAAPADFFDADYHRLLAPFHPEHEARAEVAALRELIGLAQDERILDAGCGWGRHLRLLREAGHDVVGVDLSLPLLRNALTATRSTRSVSGSDSGSGSGSDSGSRPGPGPGSDPGSGPGPGSDSVPSLVCADLRVLPFRDASIDVVLNLATSLGLFLDDRDAVAALAGMRRVLRPGGRLLIEGMHRDDVVANYAERDGWTLDDGTRVRVRRRLDAARGVSHEALRWRGPGGAGRKRHSLRLRSAEEMSALLDAAKLRVLATYGGWEGDPLTPRSERLILLAQA